MAVKQITAMKNRGLLTDTEADQIIEYAQAIIDNIES